MINQLYCFFSSEGHVALDRNQGVGYNALLLRLIAGDLLSACPHIHFHTLPSLLDSSAAQSNSYPNACVPMQEGSLYHFYDGLWHVPAGTRTHDLPCERRTRYTLSQPDTVLMKKSGKFMMMADGINRRLLQSFCLILPAVLYCVNMHIYCLSIDMAGYFPDLSTCCKCEKTLDNILFSFRIIKREARNLDKEAQGFA